MGFHWLKSIVDSCLGYILCYVPLIIFLLSIIVFINLYGLSLVKNYSRFLSCVLGNYMSYESKGKIYMVLEMITVQ